MMHWLKYTPLHKIQTN